MDSENHEETIIDTEKISLDNWLKLVFQPPNKNSLFIDYEFPAEDLFEEYLSGIDKYSEGEVERLIKKFLIPSCTLGADRYMPIYTKKLRSGKLVPFNQFYGRLYLNRKGYDVKPWEGITWILDLLPHFPKQAIDGLNSYILAHAQLLPDGRFRGLNQVVQLIRAKYIGLPGTQGEKIQYLKNLAPRDFECIVERLYHALGYETQLTPQTRDGGKDVIASITMHGGIERILIECKKYTEEPIRINLLRELLGMVSHENVNKGIIVTTTEFTKDSTLFAESDSRLGLVDGDKLVRMLNEFMGPTWPRNIDRYITASLKHNNNH